MQSVREDTQTHAVIGAAMAVHSVLGPGFLESVYAGALEREMQARGIPYQREVSLPLHYKGEQLGVGFRVDFICYEGLLLELKAQAMTGKPELSQILNYLKASRLERALLINFGATRLQYRRIVR